MTQKTQRIDPARKMDRHDNGFAFTHSSTTVAPALISISLEFNIKFEVVFRLMLSIFVLAYAVGPPFLGPLSETYSRAVILQAANFSTLLSILAAALCRTQGK